MSVREQRRNAYQLLSFSRPQKQIFIFNHKQISFYKNVFFSFEKRTMQIKLTK